MLDILDYIEILKAITHPIRIKIFKELSKGVKCVSDFEDFLHGVSQPNISQHLSKLKNAGIIYYFIDGKLRCYFMKSALVQDSLNLLEKEYSNELPGPECCPVTKKGTYSGARSR
jgi:ArsR family transcriptional regulator